MGAIRAPWTSNSFLLYLGGLMIAAATLWLLGDLADDHGDAAFTGLALLACAAALVCAFAFRRAGRPLAAGLLAVTASLSFAVFVGAFEDWIGWLPDERDALFGGFDLSVIVLELAALAFALWALRAFRFPLLVLVAVLGAWLLFADTISNGGDWTAIVTIAFGLVVLAVAGAVEPVYAFWLHVAAGLTIGGGLAWFWHSSTLDWILVGLLGLVYIWIGDAIARSSWTVLGAGGVIAAATHFIQDWFGSFGFFLFFYDFGGDGEGSEHPWARSFSFVVLGFVFLLLAFLLAARRRRAAAPVGPAPQ